VGEYAILLSLTREVRSTTKRERYIVDAGAWQKILNLDLLRRLMKAGSPEKGKTPSLNKLLRPTENRINPSSGD